MTKARLAMWIAGYKMQKRIFASPLNLRLGESCCIEEFKGAFGVHNWNKKMNHCIGQIVSHLLFEQDPFVETN